MALGGGYGLKTDLRYFNNSEDGKALYEDIDNQSYGVMTTLKRAPMPWVPAINACSATPSFPTLNGYAPQPYLVNWSTVAFVKPNEFLAIAL